MQEIIAHIAIVLGDKINPTKRNTRRFYVVAGGVQDKEKIKEKNKRINMLNKNGVLHQQKRCFVSKTEKLAVQFLQGEIK